MGHWEADSVGRTQVQARIFGDRETREYTFLVDTGIVEADTYFADGELMGQEFGAILVPASTPLIGYELLENLRYRVNPVTQQIEKVPEDEVHPPYLL